MTRGWALRIVACLAAVGLMLTGCSQAHKPSASSPTRTTTSSSAASPTLPSLGPADFPVPAEARQKTEAGVQAFARYFIDLINHQNASLDSAPIRALSRNCADCNQLAQGLDEAKRSGWTYDGGHLSFDWLSNSVLHGDTAEIGFVLIQQPYMMRDANGNPVPGRSSPVSKLNGGLALAWDATNTTWVVTTLTADPM